MASRCSLALALSHPRLDALWLQRRRRQDGLGDPRWLVSRRCAPNVPSLDATALTLALLTPTDGPVRRTGCARGKAMGQPTSSGRG